MEYDYSGEWVHTERGRSRNKQGVRFGRLVAEKLVIVDGVISWECKCNCGNTIVTRSSALISNEKGKRSCGCLVHEKMIKAAHAKFKDITGERFGRVVVLGVSDETYRNERKWKCLCDCGNIIHSRVSWLRGKTERSCGCKTRDKIKKAKVVDYTGLRYNKLLVVKHVGLDTGGRALLECVCDCGETRIVPSHSLVSGDVKRCLTCARKKMIDASLIDMTGDVRGRLTVLERDCSINDGRARWICICECGSIVSVTGKHLRNGKVSSCGCLRSVGESIISKYLQSIGVQHEREYRFFDCVDILPLPFDFYIPKYKVCIEFDGEQHSRPVDFAGKGKEWALETHAAIKRHDEIKSEYCLTNKIPLIRIDKETICDIEKIINIKSLEKLREEAS